MNHPSTDAATMMGIIKQCRPEQDESAFLTTTSNFKLAVAKCCFSMSNSEKKSFQFQFEMFWDIACNFELLSGRSTFHHRS